MAKIEVTEVKTKYIIVKFSRELKFEFTDKNRLFGMPLSKLSRKTNLIGKLRAQVRC